MASIRETPHGTFEVHYRDPSGRQRSKSWKRKTDATAFAKSVDTDKARGDWLDPRLAKIPVQVWADQWFSTIGGSPKTRDYYAGALRNYVIPELGQMPIGRVDRAVVRRFAASITEQMGKSASTRNGAVKALRGTLGFAVDAGAIKVNHAFRLRLPRDAEHEKHFLDAAQVNQLVAAMPTDKDAAMVLFTAYTGLRAGEVEALRAKHFEPTRVNVVENLIEDAAGQLHFRPTKTYQRRAVSMPAFLVTRMKDVLADLEPEDLVFPSPGGAHPMRHSNWYTRHWMPSVKRAGLPDGLRFHDLRHTCAAMLISLGANPRAVMEHLGHSSISVTFNTYGHLFPGWDDTLTDGLQKLWLEAGKKRR